MFSISSFHILCWDLTSRPWTCKSETLCMLDAFIITWTGNELNFLSPSSSMAVKQFCFKYDFGRCTMHPKFDPTRVRTYDLQTMNSTFHALETPSFLPLSPQDLNTCYTNPWNAETEQWQCVITMPLQKLLYCAPQGVQYDTRWQKTCFTLNVSMYTARLYYSAAWRIYVAYQ